MVAGTKRSTSSPQKAAKVAKTSAKSVTATADEASKRYAPALELLAEAGADLPAPCVEMLRAAAPYALATPKGERHAFQASVLSLLARLHVDEEAKRRSAIHRVEAQVAELAAARVAVAAELETAKAEEAAKREVKEAKATALKATEEAAKAAQEAVSAEREKAEKAQEEAKARAEVKEEYEKLLAEAWEPLKAGSFAPKEWRARNKAIARVCELLSEAGAAESLSVALPVALKESAQARGDFAGKALEHGEAALRGHLASLAAQVEGHRGAAAEQGKAVAAAEDRLRAADAALQATMQESIDTDNAWVDADSKVFDLKARVDGFAPTEAELNGELAGAKAALDSLHSLVAQFEALIDPEAETKA